MSILLLLLILQSCITGGFTPMTSGGRIIQVSIESILF